MSLARFVGETLQLIWPARCAACDAIIPDAATFCDECAAALSPLVGVCGGCALPQDAPVAGGHRCRTCRRVPFAFASGQAVFEYGESIARAIVRMKHGGRRDLGKRLARLLAPALAALFARAALGPDDLVMPVPLHPEAAGTRLQPGLRDGPGGAPNRARQPSRGAAVRTRPLASHPTDPRARSLWPAARLAEVAGAFAVRDAARVRGRRMVVIDDVFTTGATFSECAGALRAAGAAAVHVLALARAV